MSVNGRSANFDFGKAIIAWKAAKPKGRNMSRSHRPYGVSFNWLLQASQLYVIAGDTYIKVSGN